MLWSAIKNAAIAGVILSWLLFGFVLATGSTFGQRCAKLYEKDSTAWNQCVQNLAKGREADHKIPAK